MHALRHLGKHTVQAGLLGGCLISATVAHAHYPWLVLSNHTPAEGRSVNALISWGHAFPIEDLMPKDRLESIALVTPDGKRHALENTDDVQYKTPALDTPGVYTVLAAQTGSYWTRSRQGPKRGSKVGVEDAISCSYFSNNMKAVLTVGNGGAPSGQAYGQPLEIIPISNPVELRFGDYMDVQVLLKGEPFRGMVFATYAGFSNEGAYAYSVEANNEGRASIRILHPGKWMVRANIRQPYPDASVCDVESYTTTLTFSVR